MTALLGGNLTATDSEHEGVDDSVRKGVDNLPLGRFVLPESQQLGHDLVLATRESITVTTRVSITVTTRESITVWA